MNCKTGHALCRSERLSDQGYSGDPHRDASHSSAIYVLSTLLSILTMPLMIGLFELLLWNMEKGRPASQQGCLYNYKDVSL